MYNLILLTPNKNVVANKIDKNPMIINGTEEVFSLNSAIPEEIKIETAGIAGKI
ncbi:hypothetical protein [Thermodesulfovibrio sp.]|uniref:hypothetical protein n=1 Tax=Thermodesulfovibrio sp. TaxID=2067987 RepID=UPI00309DF838